MRSRLTALALIALLSVSLGSGAGAGEKKDDKTLTDTVKEVVASRIHAGDSNGPVPIALPGADSLDVASGILDEVLLAPDPYYYESLGRRDPFVSLVDFEESGDGEMDVTGSGDLWVVGILWGDNDKFALIETADGASAILREGDRFRNASVSQIKQDGIVLYVNQYGIGRTLALPLTEGKDAKHAGNER